MGWTGSRFCVSCFSASKHPRTRIIISLHTLLLLLSLNFKPLLISANLSRLSAHAEIHGANAHFTGTSEGHEGQRDSACNGSW